VKQQGEKRAKSIGSKPKKRNHLPGTKGTTRGRGDGGNINVKKGVSTLCHTGKYKHVDGGALHAEGGDRDLVTTSSCEAMRFSPLRTDRKL